MMTLIGVFFSWRLLLFLERNQQVGGGALLPRM